VLLEQDFVRDEKVKIIDLLGDATLKRFAQVVVGQ
jgi:translation elongation factor EF-Ts